MTQPDTSASCDTAFHPDSLVGKHIKDGVVKTIRLLVNEKLDGASFTAYAIDGQFKVTIERLKS